MSRTDIHAPWIVQLHRGDCAAVAVHDHTTGVCDLPPTPPAQWNNGSGYNPPGCHWSQAARQVNNTCGCSLCTGKYERREDRRRDRHDAKRALRKEAETP